MQYSIRPISILFPPVMLTGLCFLTALGLTLGCSPEPPPPCGEVPSQETRIVGGQETAPNAYPWQVGLSIYLYIYLSIYKDDHFISRRLAKHTGLFPGSTPCTPIHQCLTITAKFHGFYILPKVWEWKLEREIKSSARLGITQLRSRL